MPTADTTRSTIKPTAKAVQTYYEALKSFGALNVTHETGVRTAFQNLLTETARTQKWTLITEQTLKASGKGVIRPDGVMHYPGYREKFADNLKRELPRIPFAPDFRAFAEAGRKLADLHLNYETVTPFKLDWIEAKDTPFSYRVEKMKLNKDKTQVVVNDSLTLAGVPPEVFNYRLGNRSALDWVIDQYQVSTDKRSGITSDPNREDDERYIVDLVGRVIAVSVETTRIVAGPPEQYSPV